MVRGVFSPNRESPSNQSLQGSWMRQSTSRELMRSIRVQGFTNGKRARYHLRIVASKFILKDCTQRLRVPVEQWFITG